MTDYNAAAQTLIARLNAPAQYHSVWIRTEVDQDGQFQKALCVSIRPGHENKVKIPTEHMGIPVTRVPWPEGS